MRSPSGIVVEVVGPDDAIVVGGHAPALCVLYVRARDVHTQAVDTFLMPKTQEKLKTKH